MAHSFESSILSFMGSTGSACENLGGGSGYRFFETQTGIMGIRKAPKAMIPEPLGQW
jgi:hypothetical protein